MKVDCRTEECNPAPDFPFATDPDDHCESPREAYSDIKSLLLQLSGNRSAEFKIYDPYYCDGAVVRHLGELGFHNVHNKREDCYSTWTDGKKFPSFDILLTNPPYSGNHIERLLALVTSPRFGTKPWFLLLPNWVHKKDYYESCVKRMRPFYLVPRRRYVYQPPTGFRASRKSDVHKKSSPFFSMWYIWGGTNERTEQLIRTFYKMRRSSPTCDLARSKSALRDLRRKGP